MDKENASFTDFFLLSEMIEDENGEISFKMDTVRPSLTDCIDYVRTSLNRHIGEKFTADEIEQGKANLPSNEEIYKSLFADKYLCYIIGEGSDEFKIVYHVSKISIGSQVETAEMSFCQQ